MKNYKRELYRQLPLVDLIKKIVNESDPVALEEFHNNRTVFRFRSGEKCELRFIEFLYWLCEKVEYDKSLGRQAFEIASTAFDITLKKFKNLPGQSTLPVKTDPQKNRTKRGRGPDCRRYYKAYLTRITKLFRDKPPASQIEAEDRAALCMQGLVRYHFYLDQLEAKRKISKSWSRYNWNIKGGTIRILMPVVINGHKRREWLEKNIKDPDPDKEGEKQRIQKIIDTKLKTVSKVIDGITELQNGGAPLWPKKDEEFGIILGQVVADEKAENIDQLRRSVRNLGKKKLKRMIVRIFEDVNSQEYEDGKIAKEFGLSKATFSRFAGSRWSEAKSPIPDLWLNTAKVLSEHEIFDEVATQTGYLEIAKTILRENSPQAPEKN